MTSAQKKKLRERLSEAQNHRCAYCGKRFGAHYYDRCTIEHYQARSHGGRTTYENTVAACCKCDQRRATMHPIKFWLRINRQAQGIAA